MERIVSTPPPVRDRPRAIVRAIGLGLAILAIAAGVWLLHDRARTGFGRARRARAVIESSHSRGPAPAPAPAAQEIGETDEPVDDAGSPGTGTRLRDTTGTPAVTEDFRDTRTAAEGATVPVEAEGKFAVLYEKWLSEAEDSEATREATDFLRERITKLGLEPSASYLSCRQSLCRMGVGFENFRDLHELNKIELPDGVQPEVTEPYLYGKTNVIVVYWSRKAAE